MVFNYTNIILAVVALLLFIGLFWFIFHKLSRHRKFNDQPRTHSEKVEDIYDDDSQEKTKDKAKDKDKKHDDPARKTIDLGIARANDELFDSWLPIQELMKEIGIRRIINNMIEYQMDDDSIVFVGIAVMQQSNPFLKTQEERNIDVALQEVFLDGLNVHTKISSQHQRTDMTNFFQEQERNIHNSDEPINIQQQGIDILKDARAEEENINRSTNVCYVQFTVDVTDKEIYGDNTRQLEQAIYEEANTKINQAILKANQALSSREHTLTRLDNTDLLELIYKTFNRDTAKLIPFDRIIREQKFSLWTTTCKTDEEVERTRQFLQTLGKSKVKIDNDPHIQALKKNMQEAYQAYEKACHQVTEETYQQIQTDEVQQAQRQINNAERSE